MTTKGEIDAVRLVGEKIGYGHLMSLAAALWRQKLRETGVPETGAFYPALVLDLEGEAREIADKEISHYDHILLKNDI